MILLVSQNLFFRADFSRLTDDFKRGPTVVSLRVYALMGILAIARKVRQFWDEFIW